MHAPRVASWALQPGFNLGKCLIWRRCPGSLRYALPGALFRCGWLPAGRSCRRRGRVPPNAEFPFRPASSCPDIPMPAAWGGLGRPRRRPATRQAGHPPGGPGGRRRPICGGPGPASPRMRQRTHTRQAPRASCFAMRPRGHCTKAILGTEDIVECTMRCRNWMCVQQPSFSQYHIVSDWSCEHNAKRIT